MAIAIRIVGKAPRQLALAIARSSSLERHGASADARRRDRVKVISIVADAEALPRVGPVELEPSDARIASHATWAVAEPSRPSELLGLHRRGVDLALQPALLLTVLQALPPTARWPFAWSRPTTPVGGDPLIDATIAAARETSGILSVPSLADSVHVSRRTLERRVAGAGAGTPVAVLRRARHEAACFLLLGGVSQAVAARVLGFSDPRDFAAAFRRLAGQPPGRWLRSRRESLATGRPPRVTPSRELRANARARRSPEAERSCERGRSFPSMPATPPPP